MEKEEGKGNEEYEEIIKEKKPRRRGGGRKKTVVSILYRLTVTRSVWLIPEP